MLFSENPLLLNLLMLVLNKNHKLIKKLKKCENFNILYFIIKYIIYGSTKNTQIIIIFYIYILFIRLDN